MRSKFVALMVFATLAVPVGIPVYAQSNPAAMQGRWPVIIGGGMSVFNMDFPPNTQNSKTTMEGGTLWADWNGIPFVPRQLGLEAEYRDLSLNAPSSKSGLRTKTFQGGPTYTWRLSRFAVYGKGMAGYAAIHFPPSYGSYTHDTRTLLAAGGGGEYRVWNGVWARADYEYQWWPNLVNGHPHPNGFTFSLAYDFRGVGRQY